MFLFESVFIKGAALGTFSPFAGLIWFGERIRPVDKNVPQLSANTGHNTRELNVRFIIPNRKKVSVDYCLFG